jgi:hypothetical protein
MFGLWKMFACAALTVAGTEEAAAHSFRETVNRILLGSAQDKSGLVEIQNASDCTVKLSNPKNASYAVLRFNNVDPRSFKVRGKPGETFITFGGPDVVLEVHNSDAQITAASERIQISAGDPAEERRSFHQLYARFCSGKRSTSVGVGS